MRPDHERCPGCGNVIYREAGKVVGRNFCWPVEVDRTLPGYRYLANTWGYCYTLSRHYGLDEPVWLETIRGLHGDVPQDSDVVQARRQGQDDAW